MYSIERTNYGFKLTFSGKIDKEEMQKWYDESMEYLKNVPEEFFVFVDMRNLTPLLQDAQAIMTNGQAKYREKGMKRSVVIVDNPITKLQFKRLAQESGIYKWERYIDAETHPNWEQLGMDWLENASEPE